MKFSGIKLLNSNEELAMIDEIFMNYHEPFLVARNIVELIWNSGSLSELATKQLEDYLSYYYEKDIVKRVWDIINSSIDDKKILIDRFFLDEDVDYELKKEAIIFFEKEYFLEFTQEEREYYYYKLGVFEGNKPKTPTFKNVK